MNSTRLILHEFTHLFEDIRSYPHMLLNIVHTFFYSVITHSNVTQTCMTSVENEGRYFEECFRFFSSSIQWRWTKLLDFQHSTKYTLLCYAEQRKYMFGV